MCSRGRRVVWRGGRLTAVMDMWAAPSQTVLRRRLRMGMIPAGPGRRSTTYRCGRLAILAHCVLGRHAADDQHLHSRGGQEHGMGRQDRRRNPSHNLSGRRSRSAPPMVPQEATGTTLAWESPRSARFTDRWRGRHHSVRGTRRLAGALCPCQSREVTGWVLRSVPAVGRRRVCRGRDCQGGGAYLPCRLVGSRSRLASRGCRASRVPVPGL